MRDENEDLAAEIAKTAADAAARGDEVEAPAEKVEEVEKPAVEAKIDDDAETDDEKTARETEEAEEAKKKRVRIPLDRHEKVLEAARAEARSREEELRARVAQLERTTPAPQHKDMLGELKTKIDAAQDQYEDLLFEGEKDQARMARKQLDVMREQYTDAKVAASGNLARVQTIDALKYDATLARVESEYPELNPDNAETFVESRAVEVAELLTMFQQNGMTRQSALEKAVKYVMGDRKAPITDAATETMAQRRAQEARQKAADASKRQPASTAVAGLDSDKAGNRSNQKIDIMKVSQAQFAKITEEDLAAMRGDAL